MTSPSSPPRRSRRDAIEILEARIAPATLVTLDPASHVLIVQGDYVDDGGSTVQVGAPETLSFTVSGQTLSIIDSTHGVTVVVGSGLSQAGTGQVNVPLTALTGDIVIDTGTGADSLSFAGSLALAVNKGLIAHTTGTINFAPTSKLTATGTGKLSLTTERDISSATGAMLSVVNGDLDLTAHGTLGGNYSGLSIGGAIMSTGVGKITLTGTGGNNNDGNNGIDVHGQITAAGAGSLRLVGQGGPGNNANSGIFASSGAISAGIGGIILNGMPGGDAGDSLGIDLSIPVTSAGNIDLVTNKGLRFDPGTAVNAADGIVTLAPATSGTAIKLGSFQQAAFGISDAMLGVVTANKVVIGSAVAGAISVDGAIDSQNSLTLKSGSTVGGLADFGVAAGRSLSIEAGGTIQLQGTVSVSAGLLSLIGVGGAGGGIGVSLVNAQNDFATVHVVNGAAVELRDLDGFAFDAQASTLLSLNSSGTITQSGAITGGADLLKLGAGTLLLNQANAIGNTTIGAGSIVFSNAGALGSGTITLGSATVGSVNVSLFAAGAVPSGTFLHPIVVPNILGGGVVKLGSVAAATGAVHFEGSLTLDRPATLQSASTGGTFFEGALSGNVGTLTIDGGGRVALGTSANSFTGNVKIVNTSTLELLPGPDAVPDASNVDVELDSFFLLSKGIGQGEIIGNLTGGGRIMSSPSVPIPQALTITANGALFQFEGFISDGAAPLSIIKDGAGTAHMEGELTYSGPTIVKSGTLQLVNPDSSDSIANSSIIDVRSGATLDVLGLGGAGITQTLVLAPNQTLMGSGTILGNLTGTGKVFPGDPSTPGILTINGNFTPGGQVGFKVNGPYTTPGGNFDQIVIGGSGLLDLSAAQLVLFGGIGAPAAGAMVKLIANNGPGATVAGTSPAEGAIIGTGDAAFTVNYNAGNGSDVVLTASPGVISLSATLNKGTLTVSDSLAVGRPHRLSYSVIGANVLITDLVEFFGSAPAGAQVVDNGHTLSIPASLVKAVQINGGGGDDLLTVDFSSPKKLPAGGFVFDGGLQASSVGDQLVLRGTDEGAVTYAYTNRSAGSVTLSNFGKITLAGLESVVNKGNATSQLFNLPAGVNFAALSDDGVVGNGLTRLSGLSIPVTDFAAPTFHGPASGVSINPGGPTDTLNVLLLPDFDDNLFVGSPFRPFDIVTFVNSADFTQSLEIDTHILTLPTALHLSALDGELGVSGGAIDGTLRGGLSLVKTVSAAAGTPLVLNGANTYTGETVVVDGPLLLANALAAQNSTLRIFNGEEVQFKGGIVNFTVGGLAGTGGLLLADEMSGPVELQVGRNDSTYAGVLSGPGSLHKTGGGTLTLTGKNTHTGTFLEGGILRINSELALGKAAPLIADGGTLQAVTTATVARNIVLQSSSTFQASAGKTLTLSGVISGAGDLLIGDVGTVLVTGQANTNTGGVELGGGAAQMVNGVTISSPGIKSGIMITPGPMPGEVAKIDLSGVNVPVSLVIKNPKTGTVTVDKIVSNDNTAIKMISLGTNVKLGDGMADSTPDLVVNGKLTTLVTGDVNANTIIQLGKGLAYTDTYKNVPNVTLHDVLGAGVVIDVTGNGISGLLGGIGGGGLGKIVVNQWAAPGLIKTTQSIKSLTVKTGDSNVSLEVDKDHVGTLTTGNVGLVSIPAGQWAGASMQVEGVVAQFLTKGLAMGSTITAGAFGTVNIKGNYAGSILAVYDPTVNVPVKNKPPRILATGAIGGVTISTGDFTGVVSGDGKVGNITLTGTARFMGTLRGGSIGNITAASFTGTGAMMGDPRHTITAIGSIGNITAKTGGLTDYIIAAGTDLGSDALFGGVADTFHSFYLTATNVKTAVSIGTVTIKGVVQNTTIAAGVNPGADGYGDNDVLVALPVEVTKTKVKIGAMTFDANPISDLTFSGTAPSTVTNAFEAQVLTSIKFGKGAAAATNPQFKKDFTVPTYFDSGGSSVVVRLLS